MHSFMQKSSGLLANLLGIKPKTKGGVRAAKYLTSVAQAHADMVAILRTMYKEVKADRYSMPVMPRWNTALFNAGSFKDCGYYTVERAEVYLFLTNADTQYVLIAAMLPSMDLADFRLFKVQYEVPSMGYNRVHFNGTNPFPELMDSLRSTYSKYITA